MRIASSEIEGVNGVDIGYIVNGGDQALHRVRARHCVLACFNMGLPYILDGLPERQALALKQNIKAPLVYSNVAVRNWEPWVKLGAHDIFAVNNFHSRIKLDYPVSIGDYSCSPDPSHPTIVHMVHVPSVEGAPDVATALRMARKTLFSNKFEDIEGHIRNDLNQILGPAGFDADRDILGITINRWSHGYSWFENSLSKAAQESQTYETYTRQPLAGGLITIANSDSGWSAYAHSAIDQAHRAVQELVL